MDTDVRTYAQQAIDRWTVRGMLTPGPGRTTKALHDPRACECLSCSDGRVALGMTPLVPSWARRSVPSFYRRRYR